ncbi:MAG: Rpn family recombination-promoting nuclease/putative transposase, partial [Epsilonproteobacteria bacterium]|nr:Rpn family recombination-promoting nuclease/putative transposase [Campylobacterota bacterium]
ITENLAKGEKYSAIKKVYSVNILYFDLGHGEDYIYHGTTSFLGLHKNDKLELNETQKELYKKELIHEIYPEYYLLKVNQFNDVAKDTLDQWIYFLKNDEIKNSFNAKGLVQAKDVLDVMKLSKDDAVRYEKFLEDLHYQASLIETRNKNSFDAGIVEGRAEGEKIGIEIGILEGKKETARNLKKLGLDLSSITEATGLTIKEIEKL